MFVALLTGQVDVEVVWCDSGWRVGSFVKLQTSGVVAHFILFMPEGEGGGGQQVSLEDEVAECEIFGDCASSMQGDSEETIVERVNLPLSDGLLVVKCHGLTNRS